MKKNNGWIMLDGRIGQKNKTEIYPLEENFENDFYKLGMLRDGSFVAYVGEASPNIGFLASYQNGVRNNQKVDE